MTEQTTLFLKKFYQIFMAFTLTVLLIRVYEYISVANKLFVKHTFLYELLGLCYDVWACFIYAIPCLFIAWLLQLWSQRVAWFFVHLLHVLLLIAYICLIIVFSERNNPFDHEFFTRSAADSWETVKQMMTAGMGVFLPFIIYCTLYIVLVQILRNRWFVSAMLSKTMLAISVLAFACLAWANPNEASFSSAAKYYLSCNKMSYWVADSYQYFAHKDKFDANKLSSEEITSAIAFYQQNHPFAYSSKEYPLLHENNEPDVLGHFFNLDSTTPPNIVILVVEGLSRDFSGDKAYATSFTPFLDSLSKHSLTWDNFLSTAPATFAAHPSIEGSLPYAKRGFSSMNVMPDHLSLIKILRANGYHSKFLIGFNPDFDNMGGFIRLQGTDMVLTKYGAKYKEMGVGEEGWSMGYPDDALFSRSFEVMDSLKQTPYLNIYHTGTTHMPYLFEQKPHYEKLFDKKLQQLKVDKDIKTTLKECKKVLVTYMFADDCFRDFFTQYAKRPDYKNTLFFITGDHHIGSFPSTGSIDDYHVPLIVYSPMLKAPKKFYAVNSHLNIAPTISALLMHNYPKLTYKPKQVHWLGGVMDTFAGFRNQQSMAFMAWSREIPDYIWKDYMLSNNQLYKLTPDLLMEKIKDDAVQQHMTALLNNFKIINSYVCSKNKIYPASQLKELGGEKKLLLDYADTKEKTIYTTSADTSLMPEFKLPQGYAYLYVEVQADVLLKTPGTEDQPSVRFALIDTTNKGRDYVFYTNHDMVEITQTGEFAPQQWNTISTNDMFTMNDYKSYKNLVFDLAVYAQRTIHLQMKNLRLKIYGVK